MMDHPTGSLQSLALGELDRDDARAVMEHADTCAACAGELADAMRGVAALAYAAGAEQPSHQRPAVHARDSRWLVGGLAAAVLVLGVWNVQLDMMAASVPVDALVNSHFAHHALAGAGGHAKLIEALDGSWVYIVATGLRPLRAYDVLVDGMKIGSIRADLTGDATGYWRRQAGKIANAALAGQDSTLRWDGR